MSLKPKRGIGSLEACKHGGIDVAELKAAGVDPKDVLDFSVCTNPFMPPPGIKEMLGTIAIEQYPDSASTELRQSLARHLGVSGGNILAGSGTTEILRLIAMTYFRRGDSVLILEPAYGDYEIASRMAGARIVRYKAAEKDNFRPDIKEVAELVKKVQPAGIFICNPDNPTGQYLSRRDIEQVLEVMGDGLLVIDEAYVDFVEKIWDSNELIKRDNVIILRSMTKNYGLAGLRLGYCLAHREIIDSLRKICWPWNVNIVAQKVGAAVLEREAYLTESLHRTQEAAQFLIENFRGLGFTILPSATHYFLMKVGSAREFRNSLLEGGLLVRDCTSFGIPEMVRISPRTLPECEKLIRTIKELIKESEGRN